jgi:hypothetical protein
VRGPSRILVGRSETAVPPSPSDGQNPYESPRGPAARPRERFKNPLDLWVALGFLIVGGALLLYGLRLVLTRPLAGVYAYPIAGGIGLMLVAWLKYSLSPRRRTGVESDEA